MKAARCIPNEYRTRLATYLVRRPYVEDNNDDGGWSRHAHLSPREEYMRSATSSDPNTLEVLAYVKADGSVITLMGRSDAQHGSPSSFEEGSPLEWVVFDDVEGMDRALGKVTYIDVDGNEKDYWLDSIYEAALTTRESYCMSLISASWHKLVRGGQFVSLSDLRGNGGVHDHEMLVVSHVVGVSPSLSASPVMEWTYLDGIRGRVLSDVTIRMPSSVVQVVPLRAVTHHPHDSLQWMHRLSVILICQMVNCAEQ